MTDMVNRPPHYLKGKIEVMDFVDDQDMDRYQFTITRYLIRWKDKGGVEDLKKAQWYLNRYVEVENGKLEKLQAHFQEAKWSAIKARRAILKKPPKKKSRSSR